MPLNQPAILPLPPDAQLETLKILKRLPSVHRYLAELKGKAKTIPNEQILINTLTLQETKASSETENIVTTHDELYKAALFPGLLSGSRRQGSQPLRYGVEDRFRSDQG